MIGTCEFCDRNEIELTIHHLTPRELGGSHLPIAYLCKSCHKQIHTVFKPRTGNPTKYRAFLKDDEALKKYLKWIKKQPVMRAVRIRKSKTK